MRSQLGGLREFHRNKPSHPSLRVVLLGETPSFPGVSLSFLARGNWIRVALSPFLSVLPLKDRLPFLRWCSGSSSFLDLAAAARFLLFAAFPSQSADEVFFLGLARRCPASFREQRLVAVVLEFFFLSLQARTIFLFFSLWRSSVSFQSDFRSSRESGQEFLRELPYRPPLVPFPPPLPRPSSFFGNGRSAEDPLLFAPIFLGWGLFLSGSRPFPPLLV